MVNIISKKFNYVYITTNLFNGKKYVGSHCTDNIDDNYLGTGRYFLRAVKKYGRDNFKREILEECDDILSARKLEEKYIKKCKTLFPLGYNLSPTGGCEKGFVGALSEEHKKIIYEKVIKKQKGRTYEEIYGEKRAIEIKEKQNQLKRGRKQSEKTIQKRIEKIKGKQKGKTYEELYGIEKANRMKEKQKIAKLGKSTSRKGKGHKLQLIEKYGEEEGLKRYEIFIKKQKISHQKNENKIISFNDKCF